MRLGNLLITWWLGNEKQFGASIKARPIPTILKSLVVIGIAGVVVYLGAYLYARGSSAGSLSTHAKFSINASVYLREYPADKNIINLDNVGTLRPFYTFENPNPASQITLARNMTVSVLSKLNAPQSNGAAYFYQQEPDEGNLFTFYQTPTKEHKKSHEIEVADRTFLVTLFNIKNLSEDTENKFDINFEYQFGVSEK